MASKRRRDPLDDSDNRRSKRQAGRGLFGDGQGVSGLECAYFFKDGHCYWAEKCRYSHVPTGRRAAMPVKDNFGSTAGQNALRENKVYKQWQGLDQPQIRVRSPPLAAEQNQMSAPPPVPPVQQCGFPGFKIRGRAVTEQDPSAKDSQQPRSPAHARSSANFVKATVNWGPLTLADNAAPESPRRFTEQQNRTKPYVQTVPALYPLVVYQNSELPSPQQVDYLATTPLLPDHDIHRLELAHQPDTASFTARRDYNYRGEQTSGNTTKDHLSSQSRYPQTNYTKDNNDHFHSVLAYPSLQQPYVAPVSEYTQPPAPGTTEIRTYPPPHAYQNLPKPSAHSYAQPSSNPPEEHYQQSQELQQPQQADKKWATHITGRREPRLIRSQPPYTIPNDHSLHSNMQSPITASMQASQSSSPCTPRRTIAQDRSDKGLAHQRFLVEASLTPSHSPTLGLSSPTNRDRYERNHAASVAPSFTGSPYRKTPLQSPRIRLRPTATTASNRPPTIQPPSRRALPSIPPSPPPAQHPVVSPAAPTPVPFSALPRVQGPAANASQAEFAAFARSRDFELAQHIRWLEGIGVVGRRMVALDEADGARQGGPLREQVQEVSCAAEKLKVTLRRWRREGVAAPEAMNGGGGPAEGEDEENKKGQDSQGQKEGSVETQAQAQEERTTTENGGKAFI